jgi:maltose alpha-D-glucosyltransferase/alpha-amylase
VVIIDFEGEPGRPLSERRHKRSPMRDVADMLRSFHYGVQGALLDTLPSHSVRSQDRAVAAPWAHIWYSWVSARFLAAYIEGVQGLGILPAEPARFATLLDTFLLRKALYELMYELNSRPDWVLIPLRGIVELTDGAATTH